MHIHEIIFHSVSTKAVFGLNYSEKWTEVVRLYTYIDRQAGSSRGQMSVTSRVYSAHGDR